MVKRKRWPCVLKEENQQPSSEMATWSWGHGEEKEELAQLAWTVTALIPKRTLLKAGNTIFNIYTTHNYRVFCRNTVISSMELKEETYHVHLAYFQFESTWGFKTYSPINYEWGCHWQTVCAYRLEKLGYPQVGASTASARFIYALTTQGVSTPCFKMLRLYGMPVCPTDSHAVLQVSPYKYIKVKQAGVSNFRVGCIVHPDPMTLLSGTLSVLVSKFPQSPILVVVPNTSQASLNPETDMILSKENVDTSDVHESKKVRQQIKASRIVYIDPSLYSEILEHPKELCKFAQNNTRSELGIATTLHDISWGAILAIQQNKKDIIRPPNCSFQCVLMTPSVWELVDFIGCDGYQFSDGKCQRRYALGHVTLDFTS